jgi:hypothetical protein
MPRPQQVIQQQDIPAQHVEQNQQLEQLERQRRQKAQRKSPGRVTRVLADLMVFVEVEEGAAWFGLVFKPDKISEYHGEPLAELGVVVGASVPEIIWDVDTLKVSSVTIAERPRTHPFYASA